MAKYVIANIINTNDIIPVQMLIILKQTIFYPFL